MRRTLTIAIPALFLLAGIATTAQAQERTGDAPRFTYEGGEADGRFVSFGLDEATGTVCDWSYRGTLVISEMAWDDFTADVKAEGRVLIATDTGGEGTSTDTETDVEDTETDTETTDTETDTGTATGTATDTETDTMTTGTETDTETFADAGCPGGNATETDAEDDETGTETDTDTATDTSTETATETTTGTETQDYQASGGGSASKMKFHDNPTGFIKLELRGDEAVNITFADGLDVSDEGGKVFIEGEGIRARLWSSDDLEVDGSTVGVETDGNANVMFRVLRDNVQEEDRIDEAVVSGDVSAEIFVEDDDTATVTETGGDVVTVTVVEQETRIDLDINVDVDVNVEDDDDDVDGDDDVREGDLTVVVVDIDTTVIAADGDNDIVLLLDEQELARADDVDDVLVVDEGEEPEGLIIVDNDNQAKAIASVNVGESQLSLEAASGEPFRTAEPVDADEWDDDEVDIEDDGIDDGDMNAEGGEDNTDVDVDDPKVNVPGVGMLAGVVAIAAAAVLVLRRRT